MKKYIIISLGVEILTIVFTSWLYFQLRKINQVNNNQGSIIIKMLEIPALKQELVKIINNAK